MLGSLINLRLSKLQTLIDSGGVSPHELVVRRASLRRSSHAQLYHDDDGADAENEIVTDKNEERQFVTEKKDVRVKYGKKDSEIDGETTGSQPSHAALLAKSRAFQPGRVQMPEIKGTGLVTAGLRRERTAPGGPHADRPRPDVPGLERDLTDWTNWSLKDKSWISGKF